MKQSDTNAEAAAAAAAGGGVGCGSGDEDGDNDDDICVGTRSSCESSTSVYAQMPVALGQPSRA